MYPARIFGFVETAFIQAPTIRLHSSTERQLNPNWGLLTRPRSLPMRASQRSGSILRFALPSNCPFVVPREQAASALRPQHFECRSGPPGAEHGTLGLWDAVHVFQHLHVS